jgi:hypothetical protein
MSSKSSGHLSNQRSAGWIWDCTSCTSSTHIIFTRSQRVASRRGLPGVGPSAQPCSPAVKVTQLQLPTHWAMLLMRMDMGDAVA